MKLTCEIVQDLLPLYEDGVCSPGSRAAVEEHLRTCALCQGEQESAKTLPPEEILMDLPTERKNVKGLKKVRRRWAASLLAVLLLIPILLLGFNQLRGVGLCFTNADEIIIAKKFVRHIQNGRYGKAAEMYDFRPSYKNIMEALNMSPESHSPNFVSCKIGDEIWYMNTGILGDIDLGYDTANVWMQLVNNQHYGILVPVEQMEKLAVLEPGIVSNDQDGYTVNGQNYYPLATPWGTFLAEDSAIDSFIQSDRELLDYGNYFTLIPEEMYQDLEAVLLEESQRIWDLTQQLYSPVADMTEDEFCAYMREKYAAALESVFSGGINLEGNHYSIAYRINSSGYTAPGEITGGWTVGIQSVVLDDEDSKPITIYVHIEHGNIRDLSVSYADESLLDHALLEALFPRYGY